MDRVRRLADRGFVELRKDPTVAMLILANLFLVFDTWRVGRPIASILVVYWMQMLIIGFWTCVKLAIIGRLMALLYIPMFLIMYLSLVNILGVMIGGIIDDHLPLRDYFFWGGVGFFAGHGASFFHHFVGKREYLRISWENQIVLPMMRAMPMWIAVIAAAIIGNIFDSIALLALLLLPVKIFLDVTGHTLEHLILGDMPRKELEPEPT